MKIIYFIVLWAVSSMVLCADADPQKRFQQAFEEYIGTVVAPHTPGLAVTVVIDGESVLAKGYGVGKMGSADAVGTDTVFRLASISKTFTSAAVGTLIQNGELQWDSKISAYLKNIGFKNSNYAKQLTLRHLLSHTTGLVPHAYTNLIEDNMSYENILRKIKQVPFVCAPGACYGYQNIVFSLAGDIIEIVSETTFENTVEKKLLKPLKMINASYGLQAFINNKNRATPHVWSRKQKQWLPVTVKKNYYRLAPAAGVNASIDDMTSWLMAQLGHNQNILHPATLNEMHRKQIKTTRKQAHYWPDDWQNLQGVYYGLGWRVLDFNGQTGFVHHGGWVQGTRAEMIFNPRLQMGMVLLANSETRYASEVVPKFLQLYTQFYSNPTPK